MWKKKHIISGVMLFLFGAVIGGGISFFVSSNKQSKPYFKTLKFKKYYILLVEWMKFKNKGYKVADYLNKYDFTSIAIYGMGNVGNLLCEELKDEKIKIKYVVDKYYSNCFSKFDVIEVGKGLVEVDAVIVTVPFVFDKVKKELSHYLKCPIISIEDVVSCSNMYNILLRKIETKGDKICGED